MTKFISKNNGDIVDATDWNYAVTELRNMIEDSGQPVSDGDSSQVSKGTSNYVATATFYTDSGSANSYVLTPIDNFKGLEAYSNGAAVKFRGANANTGASTVNVNGLGVKNIKKPDGTTDLDAGQIITTQDTRLRYDLANDVFLLDNEEATETTRGNIKIATQATANGTTNDSDAITAAKLNARTATTTRRGVIETATQAEVDALTDTNTAVTPGTLGGRTASTTNKGIIELATLAELIAGTDNTRAPTPSTIAGLFDNGVLSTPNGRIIIPIKVSGTMQKITIQWGAEQTFHNVNTDYYGQVIFPYAFTSTPYSLMVSLEMSDAASNLANNDTSVTYKLLTSTGFNVAMGDTNNNGSDIFIRARWLAIGV